VRRRALLALLLLAASLPARADSLEEFYRGKTLTLVDYSSGGGNDVLARLIAGFIRKYIPGHPVVVVKSIIGSAGLQEANYLYNTAPRDGTVFGTVNRGTAFQPLFAGAGVQFDPLKFNWIGNTTKDVLLGVSWGPSPVGPSRTAPGGVWSWRSPKSADGARLERWLCRSRRATPISRQASASPSTRACARCAAHEIRAFPIPSSRCARRGSTRWRPFQRRTTFAACRRPALGRRAGSHTPPIGGCGQPSTVGSAAPPPRS